MGNPNVDKVKHDSRNLIRLPITVRHSSFLLPTIPSLTSNCRVIALAGLRLYYLHIALTSTNPTLSGLPEATSVTQIEIGYAILASIVPCLKNFMAAYDAPIQSRNWYQHYDTGTSRNTHELASVGTNHSISKSKSVISTLHSTSNPEVKEKEKEKSSSPVEVVYNGGKKGGGAQILNESLGKLRPEQISYEARVEYKDREGERSSREEGDGRSIESVNSRRMIIKKGVEWSVDYDRRSREAVER
jgi:hypothetical protein